MTYNLNYKVDNKMQNVIMSSIKIPVIIALLVLSNYSAAIQPLSETELGDMAEKLSVDNTQGFDTERLVYLQRENEQHANNNNFKTTAPNLLTPRDHSLIKGELTPDRVRQGNLAESLRNFKFTN